MKSKLSLTRKLKGFSGITHFLIALVIFQVLWILPFLSGAIDTIKAKGILGVILFWGIVLGSSLMPDLDNNESTAVYQLGILGKIMSMFMIMISGMFYSILRTNKDECKSQHRMFWHAPFTSIFGAIVIAFFFPKSNSTVFSILRTCIKEKTAVTNGINVSSMSIIFLFYILACSAFYLFTNVVCYRAGRIFANNFFKALKRILSIGCIIYLGAIMNVSYLRFMSYAVCLGSLLHNIGDLFSLGSVPLVFPIKIKGQYWYKPRLPIQLETGGVGNKILDLSLTITAIALFLLTKGILKI